MTNSMQLVLKRIDEIRGKFGLKKHNPAMPETTFKGALDSNIAKNEIKADKEFTIPEIKEIANEYAVKHNVPPGLVDALIKTESSYNPFAVSPKGAKGLMQLMPAAMKELGVSNPFNIRENIMGGVTHLKKLLEKYNWDYKKALAAYNAGESAVDKKGSVPPYKETRQYIKKVIDAYLKNI